MCWLIVGHLQLRDFGPYRIIFTNVCVSVTVAMVMYVCEWGGCPYSSPCTVTIDDLFWCFPVLLICQQPCACNEASYLAW
jgi:hypothetical protein